MKTMLKHPLRNVVISIRSSQKAACSVRFAQSESGSNQSQRSPQKQDVDQSKTGEKETKYGEGYATRSDEQGYGAKFSGNPSLSKEDEDKIVHGNAPEYGHGKEKSS